MGETGSRGPTQLKFLAMPLEQAAVVF